MPGFHNFLSRQAAKKKEYFLTEARRTRSGSISFSFGVRQTFYFELLKMLEKHLSVRSESALGYGIAVFLTVVFFEIKRGFIEKLPGVLAAYIAVVILAAALGWRFGLWYSPVQGAKPKLEAIGVPIVIILISVFSAGILFAGAMYLWWIFGRENPPQNPLQFIVEGGFGASMAFLYFSWRELVASSALTSLILYFRHASVSPAPP